MKLETIIEKAKNLLSNHSNVLFAYLFGSVLYSNQPGDIDVAVYLSAENFNKLTAEAELSLGFAIPLEFELEEHLHKKVDVQIINRAPLAFRHRVIKEGMLIVDNDSNKRCDFEYLSRVEYFDFNSRQKEYLREVMA